MKYKAVMLWSLLGCVGVAMLAGIVAVVLPSRYVDDRVFASIATMGAYALGGLIIVAAGQRMRWTLRVCALCTVISMAIYLSMIWFERAINWRWEQIGWKTGTVFLIISIVLAHRMLLFPLRTPLLSAKIAKRCALISAILLGSVIIVGLVNDGFWNWEELVLRLMGITAIVTAGTTIATGAFALFGPKPGEDEPGLLVGSIPVSICCPRCGNGLTIDSNRDGRCTGCRLKIRVEVEEPRCACGYLLYELAAAVCPECGSPVSEHDRWVKPVDEAE